jgi:hypothetical protein
VELVDRYQRGLLDPFVTLLEVHKLMYFMQEAGEPLRLRYVKAVYGPYAANLAHVLRAVEGHFISGYDDGGEDPRKTLELVPGAIEDATRAMAANTETHARYRRVADLVSGFESPFGLELLSTVHWVCRHEGVRGSKEVVTATHEWNERKRQFSPEQISLAHRVLADGGWLEA